MPDQPVYSIGSLARLLGVPAATLRTWESRYDLIVPERSASGQRLYSRLQLAQLRFVAGQVSAGLSPADAYRMLRERMADGGPPADEVVPDGGGQLILLAERDPYAAEFSEFYLRRDGYEVVSTIGADEARAQTLRTSPHLAVVDLLISGGRGLQLCAQLRDQLGIPVLAVSTFAQREDALAAGAGAFLRKPLPARVLLLMVRELLGRRTLQAAEADR
jgi:DNA-binding transcriptional MerR regulator